MEDHKDDHTGHGFAKGQEKLPDTHEKEHEGDFGSGQEMHDAARRRCVPTSPAARTKRIPSATRFGPTMRGVRTTRRTSDRLDDRAKDRSAT